MTIAQTFRRPPSGRDRGPLKDHPTSCASPSTCNSRRISTHPAYMACLKNRSLRAQHTDNTHLVALRLQNRPGPMSTLQLSTHVPNGTKL